MYFSIYKFRSILGLLFISCLCSYSSVNAQRSKFALGLAGGADAYYLGNTNSTTNWKVKANFALGTHFVINFNKHFGMYAGAIWSRDGFNVTYGSNATGGGLGVSPERTSSRSKYLKIPVSFHYNIIHGDGLRVAPSLGVLTSFKVKEEETTTYSNDSTAQTQIRENSYYGLITRLDIQIYFKHFSFMISPFYVQGVKSFNKDIWKNSTSVMGIHFGVFYNVFKFK